jgi:hypothetical protein
MATENRDWGYTRIIGALSNLGHNLARGTVANILKRNGIEPAPERSRKTTWKEFLTQHWDMIVAARGLDSERAAAIHGVVLYGAVVKASRDWRDFSCGERSMDDPDCPEPDRLN